MRSILIVMIFSASLASAARTGYQEVRDLNLDAVGVSLLEIEAGAGSLEITGVPGADNIVVSATIQMPEGDEDKARKKIKSHLVLSLEKKGDNAVLKAYFKRGFMNWGESPHVQLEVQVPARLGLDIDDGSGSIVVDNVAGDIEVDDGSGPISMTNVGGDVKIDDGSGSIAVEGVHGNVFVDDGSGSIRIREVAGSVTVDDGSGNINVSDVEQNLIIEEDGSGSLNFSNIGGRVEKEG